MGGCFYARDRQEQSGHRQGTVASPRNAFGCMVCFWRKTFSGWLEGTSTGQIPLFVESLPHFDTCPFANVKRLKEAMMKVTDLDHIKGCRTYPVRSWNNRPNLQDSYLGVSFFHGTPSPPPRKKTFKSRKRIVADSRWEFPRSAPPPPRKNTFLQTSPRTATRHHPDRTIFLAIYMVIKFARGVLWLRSMRFTHVWQWH